MVPAARAHSVDRGAVALDVRTEPLSSLTLRLQLAVPETAAAGSAIIIGGLASGGICGPVLPGSLEWSRDDSRGVARLALRYGVQTPDGHRLQLIDRASFPCEVQSAWREPIATTTELETADDPVADASRIAMSGLLPGITIGRLDASALGAGVLRLELHRVI